MLRLAVTLLAALARAPHSALLALTMPGAGYAPRAHAPRAPTPRTPFRMPRLDAEPSGDAAAKPRRRRRRGRRRRGGKGAAAKEKTDVVIGGPAAAGAAASWARGRRRDDVKPKPRGPASSAKKKRSAWSAKKPPRGDLFELTNLAVVGKTKDDEAKAALGDALKAHGDAARVRITFDQALA